MSCTRAILSAECTSVLQSFAQSGVLLAFDYDGTLSPIAPTPESARLPEATRQLLVRVAARYPMVVISGRALDDISARVANIGVRHVFGNHGFEWSGGKARPRIRVHRWADQLREQLAGLTGVFVEDKTHSLSVHYRLAPDNERTLQLILPIVRKLPDVRVICGAAAVNLLPKDGANKGVALRRALELTGCEKAIYVGDDDTDEDAFGALPPETLMGIRMGSSETSRATYHLEAQDSIDQLLQALIDLRAA